MRQHSLWQNDRSSVQSTGLKRNFSDETKKDVENIIGESPKRSCVKERSTYGNFITKGFPKATLSEEIAALHPTWLHHFDENRFQIQLHEDYSLYSTQGFSGSPIF